MTLSRPIHASSIGKLTTLTDLWRQAVEGDKEAEERLFENLRRRFTIIAQASIGRDDAGDVAHETCLAVLQQYKSLSEPYRYAAWCHRILRNRIADYCARKAIERRVLDETADISQLALHGSTADVPDLAISLERCIKMLLKHNQKYARALNLVHLGYRTDEICARMGVTRTNLYVILNRGRKALRDCLSKGSDE